MTTPAISANSRVFIIQGGASPEHTPVYYSCMKLTAVSQDFGEVEQVTAPNPYQAGAVILVGELRGDKGRVTASLQGRYAMDIVSTLLAYAKIGCPIDIQLHFGLCTDPSVFDKFDKAIILEDAALTSYNTDELGALSGGDSAVINETTDISAADIYEVVPVRVTPVAGTLTTSKVLDIRICEGVACVGCGSGNTGCDFSIASTAGSAIVDPPIAPVVIYNWGANSGGFWYSQDINIFSSGQDADSIDCVGDYVVAVSDEYVGLAYSPKTNITPDSTPAWLGYTTGFGSGAPKWIDAFYNIAIIVGNNGYVYLLGSNPADGVTVLDAGVAAAGDDLYNVHMYDFSTAVAVGENGCVIYMTDGKTWQVAATRPAGAGVTLNTVWVKSENEWWVGTSTGYIYYTLDQGVNWIPKTFYGSGTGTIRDIAFATKSIGYFTRTTNAPGGARLYRTYNGGKTWVLVPEKSGTLPSAFRYNHIGVCTLDPNFIVLAGVGDDDASGIILGKPEGTGVPTPTDTGMPIGLLLALTRI